MAKKIRKFFADSGDYVKGLNENVSSVFKKSKSKPVLKKGDFDVNTFESVLKKFNSRRSCRKFSSKVFEFKIIYDIIDASLKAPCAGGIQNVFVIVIENKDTMYELARVHGEQTWAGEAPLMLAVVRDLAEFEKLYSFDSDNLSLQNSTLVSSSIVNLLSITNLSCCLVRAGSNEKTCEILGISPLMSVDCLIPIGYSIDVPTYNDRLPTSERLFFEKFGNHKQGTGNK